MTEVKARVEPFACGEVLTSERAEAVLVAAAQRLMLGKCVTVAGGFESAVGRWLTRLSSEVGPSGFDISDEMLGGLALANAVLRAREAATTRGPKPPADTSWIRTTTPDQQWRERRDGGSR